MPVRVGHASPGRMVPLDLRHGATADRGRLRGKAGKAMAAPALAPEFASLTPTTGSLNPALVRREVEAVLSAFLDRKQRHAARQNPLLAETVECVRDFIFRGGKRIRPFLCVLGWRAAGGVGMPGPVVRVAAAQEMFHTFALIHDDIIDHSDIRRGKPTVHRFLADRYADRPSSQRLGADAAVIVGDLAFAWSDELLHTAGAPHDRMAAALEIVDGMRTDALYGQYHDLLATGRHTSNVAEALSIIRFKTSVYTFQHPLLLGATLAGANARLAEFFDAFAFPIGEAFQLRDDVLSVFGSPNLTGKAALDDLREGKATTLVAVALQHADHDQAGRLLDLLGDPQLDEDGAAEVRRIMVDCRAVAMVENMIAARYEQALGALDQVRLPDGLRPVFRSVADRAAWRTS